MGDVDWKQGPKGQMELVEQLLHLFGRKAEGSYNVSRKLLRACLTVQPPGSIPANAWPLLQELWTSECRERAPTVASTLPRLSSTGWGNRVSVWNGDITTLSVDAIVNAANSGLTGCYQPLHPCVDNAIHSAAGPWLREACGHIMATRGRPEPTSTATVTPGFFLPAGHVIHTVGPIVGERTVRADDERALAACYTASLGAVVDTPSVRSVAFCGISTGLFGYPTEQAAPLAISTVRSFLQQALSIEQVVFVTFTPTEQLTYARAVEEALRDVPC